MTLYRGVGSDYSMYTTRGGLYAYPRVCHTVSQLHAVKLEKKKHSPAERNLPQQSLFSNGAEARVDADEPVPSMPITSWELPLCIQNNREAFFHVQSWRKEPFVARY